MKRILVLAAVFGIGFTACKKEETENPGGGNQTTEEKIIGIWMGDEQEVSIAFPPPIGTRDSTFNISWLNVEFKADGTVTIDSAGFDTETSNWSLTASEDLILEDDTFDIMKLDASNFHFGFSETEDFGGVPVSSSTTIKLKK